MTTAPVAPAANAAAPAAGGKAAAAPPPLPFRAGTQDTTNSDGYSQAFTPGTTTTMPNYNPSVNSYLRGVWVNVQMGWSASAASVAYAGNGPFSLVSQLAFLDTQARPIIQVTGYECAEIMNKFGGYFRVGDPRSDPLYLAQTGTGAGAGSTSIFALAATGISFTLWVPLEISPRTGIGAVLNKNSSQTYTLALTMNSNAGANAVAGTTSASVFSTIPTISGTTFTGLVTIWEDGYWQPQATTFGGLPATNAPPAPDTYSYWLASTYTALNGAQQIQLPTGLGNSIRLVAFENYDTTNLTRGPSASGTGDYDFPTTVQLLYKGTQLKNWSKLLWKTAMAKHYGLTTGITQSSAALSVDSNGGLEAGVYVLDQFAGVGLTVGDGPLFALLNTDQGDQFQFIASFNASSTMYELVNYIATTGGPASLLAQ